MEQIELRSLRADAARYRYLKAHPWIADASNPEEWDRLIDVELGYESADSASVDMEEGSHDHFNRFVAGDR